MLKPEPNIRPILIPFSWLYGLGVGLRNFLFDNGILKQKKYSVPVICVGNVTVGGTGKTPHIEYILSLLSKQYKVAVVSRGYKRKSKNLQVVHVNSDVKQVGDEPFQIKLKYPNATVVVDKNRRNAIEYLLAQDKDLQPDVVLLDDGYQHRYVKTSLSVLLVDSNRPIYDEMQPINFRIFANGLNLYPFQSLFFTRFRYNRLKPVFPDFNEETYGLDDIRKKQVLLVTGIASTKPLEDMLSKKTYNLHTFYFPDHHFYNKDDIKAIDKRFAELPEDKIVITTEKDAVRLQALPYLSDELKEKLFYLPINVSFLEDTDNESFNKKIINHVRNYQKNS